MHVSLDGYSCNLRVLGACMYPWMVIFVILGSLGACMYPW